MAYSRDARSPQLGVTDASIIEASVIDPEAFGAIFDRHAATVLRYLTRRVGRSDAEDLLGEAFRIAFEARARFENTRTSALPWLYGIAANLLLKAGRSARRRDRATDRVLAQPTLRVVPDFSDGIVDATVNRALLAKIAEVVDLLPDDYREALILFTWEGLAYAEIAEAMDMPIGTVRSRLHRIRARIRELDDRIGKVPVTHATTITEGCSR